MLPIEFTGDRVTDLSLLFGLLTLGVGMIVLVMYLVYDWLIRREQGDPPSAEEPDRPDPGPETSPEERGGAPDTPAHTAHGTSDPRPGR